MPDRGFILTATSQEREPEPFSLAHVHRRKALVVVGLAVLALVIAVVSAGIGAVAIDPVTVLKIIGHHLFGTPSEITWSRTADIIVWITRMPRVLMAVAVGATLAMAGAALQAMVRNILADPYVLGVSSGASTGAAFAIVVFAGSGGIWVLSGFSFLGAILATLLVLLIGGAGGKVTPFKLVMAGMAVGYALSSVTSFLIFASDSPEASRAIMFWLLGSLAAIHWSTAQLALVVAALVLIALLAASPHLDALAAGDETALAVGIRPEASRLVLMVIVSLAVGVMVAGAGIIGFVGLIVPHMARALVGARHRVLLPASAFLGASFLLVADIGARMLFAPQEMAIGVVTGIVGAPLLLVLLNRARRKD